MTKAPSIIQAAKNRILDKDSSQRSVGLLTYNNEIYNGELFLEIIRPFTEATKNKVKALLFGDEIDIASMFGKKEEGNLVSDEQFKKMRLQEELKEIKKDPNFEKVKEIFTIVKAEYDKDRNNTDIASYIETAGINGNEKTLFLGIYLKIMEKIIPKIHKVTLEPGNNNHLLNILKENDAFFALGERDFNI